MPTRRVDGLYWDGAVVSANAYSSVARSGSGYDNFCIFLTVSGATDVALYVANVANTDIVTDTVDEDSPYYEATTNIFLPAWYLDTRLSWTFSSAGSKAILIPDFTPQYSRLKNTANGVTITASWLASGD